MSGDRLARSETLDEASLGSDGGEATFFGSGNLVDGKYAIEGTIAEGGLGVIVRAQHVGLGQTVAIKYLKPKAVAAPAIVQRFEREARLAAQIASEHVVRVQDVGRVPGVGPYMVMEYLVGRDLGSIVEEGALPVERAVDYALQAADALAEAHALQIVHRDIKPDNLFLAQRPSNSAILKIIDFGISKAPPRRNEDASWRRETAEEERFGTPLYMSPEQLRSASEVDHRTDIWSLGVVLYELIAGKPPFDAEDIPELYAKILKEAPTPLRQVRPEVPVPLEATIMRCLEKNPEDRFRNVAELAQELAPYVPDAGKRISRIRQVVRRGGHSVRPPASLPSGVAEAVDATPRVNRTTVLTRITVSSRAIVVAVGAGLAVVLAIGLLAGARSRPRRAPIAEAPAPMPTRISAATATASEVTLAPADNVPPAAATPVQLVPSAAPPPVVVAPSKPRPAPAPAPDRRTLFGERK
jgi:serine/threonine-protein kinase